MKVTDYITEFLISKNVTDVFGYPGGVICHFMDSVAKYPEITAHINYNEQAAAFSACGYGQSTGRVGIAYATSGPGATNLITGIANAYFDSTPCIFITGNVDTYGTKGELQIRQRGFQETDIVSITKSISKYSIFVPKPEDIKYHMEKCWYEATTGRPGPVVLDIPADIQRANVDIDSLEGYTANSMPIPDIDINILKDMLYASKRPCLIIGNSVKQQNFVSEVRELIHRWNIPAVMSMPAFDILPFDDELNFGFIGVNGKRHANFIVEKSDLIISIGARLDLKQVGAKRQLWASNAKLVRIDIDGNELEYKVKENEYQILCDLKYIIPVLANEISYKADKNWINICKDIFNKLKKCDIEEPHKIISALSRKVPDSFNITADVGQHLLWAAQSFMVKPNQRVYMSAGHGAMGYSLPAAIGIYYGTGKPVIAFSGDGGIQMNIQELQFIVRDNIPVKIVIINNRSLGMIRQFQEKNFNSRYYLTTEASGYTVPDYEKIAAAYGIRYSCIENAEMIENLSFTDNIPEIFEIFTPDTTYLNPNQGNPFYDMQPLIDRSLFNSLMKL